MYYISHPRWSNIRGGCLEAVVHPTLRKAQNGTVQSSIHSAQEIELGDLWRFLPNKVIHWFHMLGKLHTLNWYSVSADPGTFIIYQMLMTEKKEVIFFQKKISLKYCYYIWHLVSSSRSQKHSYKFSRYFPWQSIYFNSTLMTKSFHDVQQTRAIKRFVDKL